MTEPVFPSLRPGWTQKMSIVGGNTTLQESVSGKEVTATSWTSPRRRFGLLYEILDDVTAGELQTLGGFFMARRGRFQPFLFDFADDNAVVGALIGIGDNITTTFQLVRLFGEFVEPISAPNVVSHVYQNGVDGGGWTVDPLTGIVTFAAAPPNLVAITADFTFRFRCRFEEDAVDFEEFATKMWEAKKVEFITKK